ncbi:InlB B-repeat-containing protein [Prosthecobacter sp.]|uniref:InlB B-repeat-containing protein n=1 Tax=Prosthecobacter sp. TaxID=1965333 RepID=UPI003783444C
MLFLFPFQFCYAATHLYQATSYLTSATQPTGSQISYTYDATGNITAMAVTPGGGTTPVLTSDPAPWGQVGVAFTHTLTSSRTPATFAATGLPPGLSLTSGTGVIAGSPTTAGRYPVSVTVTSGAFNSTSVINIQVRPAANTPVILRDPQSYTTTLGQMTSLFVDADGAPPLSFQWLKNGVPISGATGMSLIIPSFTAANAGNYSVVVTNAAGSATSASARVDYLQPWAIGGESYGLPLSYAGSPPWFSQTAVSFDGSPALQSGAVADGGNTSFSTTINGPGIIYWNWKVSSQANADGIVVYLNGSPLTSVSGEQDWTQQAFLLDSGSNTLTWYYAKDGFGSSGQDRGWVANLSFAPGWYLSASPSGNGSVSRSPDQTTYANGSGVTLTATPGNGYYFDSWSGTTSSSTNPLNLTTSAHQFITAVFKENLGPAVGAPLLTWRTGGDADWHSQFYVTQNDGIAAQAGTITDGQTSWLETTVVGPGTLNFSWKVSSEAGNDGIVFAVNGTSVDSTSGEFDWVQRSFTLGSGSQTVRWTYLKNSFNASGQDTAWLDAVSFTPTGPRTFALWTGDYGLPSGQNGAVDDPNKDGVPNLLAYAFGVHPLDQAAVALPSIGKAGNNLVCTYRRSKNATGISWAPQTSTTLQQDWTGTGITHAKISEDASVEVWTATVPLTGANRRFLRIVVTQP